MNVLNQFQDAAGNAGLSAPICHTCSDTGTQCQSHECECKRDLRETPVALLNPNIRRVWNCSPALREVDRTQNISKTYLLVPDCDLSLFAHFEREHRVVLPAYNSCPHGAALPRVVQRKRSQFGGRFAQAVSGGHYNRYQDRRGDVPAPQRYCILDSDIVFFRASIVAVQVSNSIPLLTCVTNSPRTSSTMRAVATSHDFGCRPPLRHRTSSAIIFWDQQTTQR